MGSQELKDMLNAAIARELQVSIQYMWQHVQMKGVRGYTLSDEFKNIAITEMKHAEEIAERLDYLGGKPTTKPDPIFVGETLQEMIKVDIKAEEEAIELYRKIVAKAKEEGDETTHRMFRKILADEEDHHNFFTTIAEED